MNPSITAKARDAWFLLEAADLRGLPEPFAFRAYGWPGPVEVQVRSRDEVVTWAESLDVDIEQEGVDGAGWTHYIAEGVLHDIPVKVVAAKKVLS